MEPFHSPQQMFGGDMSRSPTKFILVSADYKWHQQTAVRKEQDLRPTQVLCEGLCEHDLRCLGHTAGTAPLPPSRSSTWALSLQPPEIIRKAILK